MLKKGLTEGFIFFLQELYTSHSENSLKVYITRFYHYHFVMLMCSYVNDALTESTVFVLRLFPHDIALFTGMHKHNANNGGMAVLASTVTVCVCRVFL